MRKLKAAVVGLTVGSSHTANYVESDYVGEVAICDTNKVKLDEVGDKHNIARRYTDYDRMLAEEKPDIVSVTVPNFLHLPFTVKALEAGAHVLCEKPMARNSAEAEEMLRTAKRCGKKLMINFNQRFQKEVMALKHVIDNGGLGDIYFVRTVWQRRRGVPWWYPLEGGLTTCGGGALIDLGVHVLDRAMWLCGFPTPDWVLGNTFSKLSHVEAAARGIKNFEVEDMAVAMIRMKNGAMLELEASWAGNRENEVVMTRLYGTHGGAVIETVIKPERETYHKLFLEEDGELRDFDVNDFDIAPGNVRYAFLDAVVNDTDVPCTPEQGLQINKILDAVYKSAATGAPVKL